MQKWKIEIGFNNGLIKNGVYEGEENDAAEVYTKLFTGISKVVNGIDNENGGNLFYKVGDVVFVIIKDFY